jgi:hypothetical protein
LRSSSKGFSTSRWPAGLLFSSKVIAIAACLLFIGGLTTYYYVFESGFNPVPQKTTLQTKVICFPQKQTCPEFVLANETLRVFNRTDIISQQVSLSVTASGNRSMAEVALYLDNVSLGVVDGPFDLGVARQIAVGVPTTIVVQPGTSYSVVVEGVYTDSSGARTIDYWQSVTVVASSG